MRGINGKVAVVTGGAGGIGAAICRRFGEEGASVAVFDINQDAAEAVAGTIRESGGAARAYAVDLTSQESVVAAVAGVEGELGPIDIMVNNAGWDRAGAFLDTDKDLWERIVAVNLYGPLYMHHAVLKGMVERGAGRVVNIASDAARVGSSGEAVYAFCKGGLVAFSKTMARELARKQISVNVVCPGPTDTALFTRFLRRRRVRRQAARRTGPLHSLRPPRPAGRPAGHRGFPVQRRRRVHHRSGHQRFRRPDHGRLRRPARVRPSQ